VDQWGNVLADTYSNKLLNCNGKGNFDNYQPNYEIPFIKKKKTIISFYNREAHLKKFYMESA